MTSLLLMTTLTGCVETTQQESARAKLAADRLLASQEPIEVTRRNPGVSVLDVGRVTSGGTSAIAVALRNDGTQPVTDLPISVGVITRDGRTVRLNGQAGLPYFQTHIGAIAGGASVTWVFVTRATLPTGAPFAAVGFATVTDNQGIKSLPLLSASVTAPASTRTRGQVAVTIVNHSGLAQSGLAVYASASSGRRLLAAGQGTLAQLSSSGTSTITIKLVGNSGTVPVQADAPPTNLR